MEKKIMISVIMAEYNTPIEYFKLAIESILNQTYENFEFIIIDDNSKNNIKEIINNYNDSRIKVFKNEINLGLEKSLNRGLEIAKGKYIARMDTDDIALPKRFEKEINFLENNKEYFLVSTRAYLYDGVVDKGISKKYGEIKKEDLIKDAQFIHPTVMMNKDIVLKLGGYPLIKRCEDYGLWCKAYLNGYKGYILEEPLLRYRLNLDSYKKRGIKTRKDVIKLRYEYCKKINAPIQEYFYVLKLIIAGILPSKIMYFYHKRKNKLN